MSGKRLYRSLDDRMIAGVCGGLGEYFNIDPTIIRLLMAFLTILGGGTGILVYFIAWIIIPEETGVSSPATSEEAEKLLEAEDDVPPQVPPQGTAEAGSDTSE